MHPACCLEPEPTTKLPQHAPAHAVTTRFPLPPSQPGPAPPWSLPSQYLDHPPSGYSASVTTAGQVAVDALVAPSAYEPLHNARHEWPVVHAQPPCATYQHHPPSLDLLSHAAAQQLAPERLPGKKKPAKVPSSFVERQEKLKVSKRRGPLQEKQREKTHTMRKSKRICVRCRFYKSGVCSVLAYLSLTRTFMALTLAVR